MERGSNNSLWPAEKPQDATGACQAADLKNCCQWAKPVTNALQQKINHWAEMALLINDEFVQSPEGFGFLVQDTQLVCGFVDGYDRDAGDALTPAGEMPVFKCFTMPFNACTTAADVYRHIQWAVELAAEKWRAITDENYLMV